MALHVFLFAICFLVLIPWTIYIRDKL